MIVSDIRAYGRILWRDNMPVFQMVNPSSQQFVIYAEPIINLYRNKDKFVRIKRKGKSSKKSGYYQGEIYGILEEDKYDEKPYLKITLHIGAPYKTMHLNENRELSDVVDVQEYYFPKTELIRFIKSIDAMYTQSSHFTMLLMDTEILLPGEWSLL